MTIDERTYNKVARLIEQARHRIGTRVIERFPFSFYDDGAEIANDPKMNELYNYLDASIGKDEMEIIFKK